MLSPKTPTPKQDFKERLKSAKKTGSTIVSDKRKSSGRVVEFEDGAKLRLLTTGHMVHDFADGTKVQRNPDGAAITVKQTTNATARFFYHFSTLLLLIVTFQTPTHPILKRFYLIDRQRRYQDPGKSEW